MLENRNTENAPLDCEDWQIVFGPYAQFPMLALVLAQHLSALQDLAQSNTAKATAAINRAVEELYEHSEFRSVSLELFRATVQGRLSVEVENLINQLGIRI
ncbi:MAG TPA: hypothetical protein VJ875_25225 [Pyrinomonadaceae bacterium]|nr:hypothetical protein [Pyrinomonadaceae bacterium]